MVEDVLYPSLTPLSSAGTDSTAAPSPSSAAATPSVLRLTGVASRSVAGPCCVAAPSGQSRPASCIARALSRGSPSNETIGDGSSPRPQPNHSCMSVVGDAAREVARPGGSVCVISFSSSASRCSSSSSSATRLFAERAAVARKVRTARRWASPRTRRVPQPSSITNAPCGVGWAMVCCRARLRVTASKQDSGSAAFSFARSALLNRSSRAI
mmetsp:Transcript_41252/g.130370  ORF Transcript_41252/g.130370 Transcript_41252/m.130370 type:complete len:212 (-) Transcript_41252:170-805(-)